MTNAAVIPIPDRTPDSIVGGNVKYLMEDRGLEQAALAQRVGIDQSTLSLKLHGKRKWTVGELVTVSELFGVSIDALARRRGLGGGTALYGVGTSIHRRVVGPTGLEPMTSTVEYGRSGDVLPFVRKKVALTGSPSIPAELHAS